MSFLSAICTFYNANYVICVWNKMCVYRSHNVVKLFVTSNTLLNQNMDMFQKDKWLPPL